MLELNAKEVEEKEKANAAVEKRRLKKLSDEPSLSTPSKPDEKKTKKGYAMIHVFIPRNILNYNCLYDIYHCVVSVMMLRIQILK